MAGDIAKPLPNLRHCRDRIHISHDHHDRVAGRVPLLVEVLEHLARGGVEGGLCAQGIVRIGSAREHILVEPVDEFVSGIRQVARHFLFDRATFLRPLLLRVVDPMQASGLRLQSNVKIRLPEQWQNTG